MRLGLGIPKPNAEKQILRQSESFFLYKIMVVYRQDKGSEILEVRQWGRERMAVESGWQNEAGVPAGEEAPSYSVSSKEQCYLKEAPNDLDCLSYGL